MRIAFDTISGTWGKCDTILTAHEAGGSIVQPRCSPDGRYLLVAIAAYSDFPIDKAGTCLGLIDLSDGLFRKINFDSPWTDGWHGWSRNGRWMVFTSKRMNGRFSSVYFSYFDSTGKVHSPFVLPQKNPSYYASSIIACTNPEFVTDRISFSIRQFTAAIRGNRSDAAAGDSSHYGTKYDF
jgi:hypothetical protein